jgi:hypothetical protein
MLVSMSDSNNSYEPDDHAVTDMSTNVMSVSNIYLILKPRLDLKRK